MRIKSIVKKNLSQVEPVYDVVDVEPNHNYAIATKTENRQIFVHNSVLERMRSRFMVEGKIPGCLFMVSSKKSESDFIESYIQKQKGNPDVYVCDARLWDVKPSGTYSGKMFKVAVGGSNMQSRIIEDDEDDNYYIKQGFDILEVPIEFKSGFEMDIQAALMNVAGISISYVTKFITYDALSKCYNEHNKNPFTQEILTIGMHDSLLIQDFFLPDFVPEDIYTKPLFVHVDTSLKGDRTGIGCVAVMGYRYTSRYSIEKGGMESTKEIVYHQVFSVGIQCPKGSEISFQKTREFVYYLKNVLGWNIKGISLDGFQSFDSRQQFETMGFNDTKIVSLDKTPDGYLVLKSAIYERRVSMLNLEILEKELIQLERNNMSGKVDHPVDGCFTEETKIRLVDGRVLSIKELLLEQQYRDNYVYTVNERTKKIEPKKIKKVFQTKYVTDLVRVTLDNNEIVECTPEHRFMLRDGTYKEVKDLCVGESLMPLYTKISDKGLLGYRLYYEPFEDKWHYEHKQFCSDYIKGNVVHHANYDKLNNCPNNLKSMTKSEHTIIHNNNTHDYDKVSKSLKNWYTSIKGTDKEKNRNDACRKARIKYLIETNNYRNNISVKQERISEIEKMFNVNWSNLTYSERNRYGVLYSRKIDRTIDEKIKNALVENHKKGLYDNAHKAISNRVWYTNGTKNLYIKKEDVPPEGYYRGRTIKNHKVVKIEYIHKPCRVYDLSIEDNHNFALDSGVFVHNSKDCADGFAGALYNASLHKDTYGFGIIDDNYILLDVNNNEDYIDDRTQLLNSIIGTSPTQDDHALIDSDEEVTLHDALHDYLSSVMSGESAKFISTDNNQNKSVNINNDDTLSMQEVKKENEKLIDAREEYLKAKRRQQYYNDNNSFDTDDVGGGILIF